jgi:hypothetical protein
MIVESITEIKSVHSHEKFEGIFHLKENFYLLKSYFLNDRKESKCQWHIGKTSDEQKTFEIVSRLGSSEIWDEDTSLPTFKTRALSSV